MNAEQTAPHPSITLERVGALRADIAHLFSIETMRMNFPGQGFVYFQGKLLGDSAQIFPQLRQLFETHGFTPTLRQIDENLILTGMPGVYRQTENRVAINIVLLIATVFSTLFVGAASETGFTGTELWLGVPFCASILLILGAHELGHYFAARRYNIDVSLPYFIPMPLSIIGTMGAFIRLRSPMNNRRQLLDIGAAGPLAGMVFAVPILIYGLLTSEISAVTSESAYILEGNSLLYAGLKILLFGRFLPAGGEDVHLNQFAWAGWVGLLVTGLNLLPVAQLDGGHAIYALFGKVASYLFYPVLISLVVIGLWTGNELQWGFWVILLLFFGNKHAVPLDDVTPLDFPRKLIAIGCLILFALVFVPIPLTFVDPAAGDGLQAALRFIALFL